ncbi:MAG: hypothetical protein U9R69_01930 [Thermodesulfobacteriota bacterium]|nr:hypothetical protein [Thermodesulfobacteriota bacterium]
MAKNLRVEKREEQVSLFMTDGIIFSGCVHLAQYAMRHSGEQTVLDLLREENPFLPMHSSSGEFHLVQKRMINHLRCNLPLNEGFEYTERQVKISFSGSETLQGVLKIDMPDHSVRLTDYINGGDDFFPLYFGEIAYLVNRSLIRDIVLMGG